MGAAAETIGEAIASLEPMLLDIGGAALGVGVSVFVVSKGWRLLKSLAGEGIGGGYDGGGWDDDYDDRWDDESESEREERLSAQ